MHIKFFLSILLCLLACACHAQKYHTCTVYQYYGNWRKKTPKLVKQYNMAEQLISETYFGYQDFVGEVRKHEIVHYRYQDTLLMEKVHVYPWETKYKADTLKWVYEYNELKLRISEKICEYKYHLVNPYEPADRAGYEKEKRYKCTYAQLYKHNKNGQKSEMQYKYDNPDVPGFTYRYEYDEANKLCMVTEYKDTLLFSVQHFSYKTNEYLISTTEFNRGGNPNYHYNSHIKTDEKNRVLKETMQFPDGYKVVEKNVYKGDLLVRAKRTLYRNIFSRKTITDVYVYR